MKHQSYLLFPHWVVLGLLIFNIFGCSHSALKKKPSKPESAEELFEQALKDKMAKRFDKAIERFTYLLFNFPGNLLAGDAQYQLADTYFEKKDYEQAITEFEFYLKNFPNGRYQEEATFKLALATFRSTPGVQKDQSRTLLAKEMMENFLKDYPQSQFSSEAKKILSELEGKLVEKELGAARLYFRGGERKSALVYYEHIKEKFPNIQLSERDLFYMAVCYIDTGQKEKARAIFEELVKNGQNIRLKEAAQRYLAHIKKD